MKQKLVVILIYFLVFSPLFGSNSQARSLAVSPSQQAATLASMVNQEVHVVSLPQTTEVVSPIAAAQSLICQTVNLISSAGVIQGGNHINLNQPANCYNLQVTFAAPQLVNLAVVNLPAPQKVAVFAHAAEIQSPSFASAQPVSQLPLLPASMVLVAAVIYAEKRKINAKILALKNLITGPLTLHQLQVLRC